MKEIPNPRRSPPPAPLRYRALRESGESPTPDPQFLIPNPQPPRWLWRMARGGFIGLLITVAGLVIAVAAGVADPKPVGTLQWEDHFEAAGRWQVFGEGVEISPLRFTSGVYEEGGLEIEVGRDELGGAVTRSEGLNYTFEVAGGQIEGEIGAAYGIVFEYQSPDSYTAALINGNGYVEVVSAGGQAPDSLNRGQAPDNAARGQALLPWQQWPNILLGNEANRLRVDVKNGAGLIRINDEVLLTTPIGSGEVGVIARGTAPGQRVRFGWAKLWR